MYMHTAYCVVSGKSEPLRLEMQGTGVGPQVQLIPDSHDLGNVHLFSTYRLTMELQNTGELEAVYRLMGSRCSEVISFTFYPNSGAIPPMEVETICIEAVCTAMGEFDESFFWEVDGVLQNLSVNLRGYVGAPQFDLDTQIVDFGGVSYGVENVKQIKVHNSSPSPLLFSFRIPKEEGCSSIYSTNPESCLLQPEEIKAISLSIVPMEERKFSTELFLDLMGIGNALAVVQIQAECFCPQVYLSTEILDYGNCLLRYCYIQEIELINRSNVLAQYEIAAMNDNDKTLATLEVDAACGIVPSYSQKPLKFSIQAQKLGQISFSVTVNVSGKDSKPLMLTVSAFSCGPSIQIEQPGLDAKSGPSGENDAALDFGKVQVLQDHLHILRLKNMSCIAADLKIFLSKKNTVFHIEKDGLTLKPFESQELTVKANLDDSIKFTDILKIVTEGSQHSIPLKAIGIGSTIVCSELAAGTFDFGKQVTLRPFSHTITIENQGRKQLPLAWVNMNTVAGNEKGKETESRSINLAVAGRKMVFSITPEKVVIKSHATCLFTLTGYALNPENVTEEIRCNVTTAKALCSHKLLVAADISPLKLLLSTNELIFVQNNSTTENRQDSSQILTCKNVSELPLCFELNTKQPFLVSQSECRLQPSESVDITVSFEWQNSEEKLSKTLHGSLEIVYIGTSEKEALKLHAEVNYPNLIFDAVQLDFGCVIENTLRRLQLNVKNTSSLTANYHWFLMDDADAVLVNAKGSQNPNESLCINQLFDILPIRGCLEPGEEEVVELSYYAYPGYQCHARAICEVEGGPRYPILLEAESGLVNYTLSETSLDFGFQQFNQTTEKLLTLLNSGKIPISFSVGLPYPTQSPYLKVVPLQHGTLDSGQKQIFTVSICPIVPEKYKTQITVQISYFLPHEICISGEGVFPRVSVSLPRIRNHKFLTTARKAIENFSRDKLTFSREETLTTGEGGDFAEPQTSLDELGLTYKEPTVEHVDAETDRLILVESLAINEENEDLVILQSESSEVSSGKEHSSGKKTRDVEKFALNSYLCDFGNVILGESHQKSICISNASVLPVSFRGEKTHLKGTGFFFEPDQQFKLSVTQNSKMVDLSIMLKTDGQKFKPGIIEASIPLCIREAPRTILVLKANVTKPVLDFSTDCLDFDSVLLGQCKIMYVQFHNAGKVPCTWEILKPEPNISDFASIRDFSAFCCSPSLGTVMPNEYFNMEVRFMPAHKLRSYSVKLPIKILHDSELQFISCKGHSYNLPFCVEPTEVQLAPIIPKGTPPVQCTLDVLNNSDQNIEVYSLDFDAQFIEEENILRNIKSYNEEGFLFLPPRQAGQPFWTELMPVTTLTTSACRQIENSGPRDSWKVMKEKILPSRKGGNAKKTKDEPIIVGSPPFGLDTPILILHGPPLSGKTTQAKLLSIKFNFPVIDVSQITQTLRIPVRGDGTESEKLQGYATCIEEASPQEKELITAIRERLNKPDCKHGVIFDGLSSESLESVAIVKCILFSVGLQLSNVALQKDLDTSTQVEEEKPTQVWVGNPLVYVLLISFEQNGLAYRYAQIPEVDHAKEKVDLLQERSFEEIHYPFCTRFPSQEMLDLFFLGESALHHFLGSNVDAALESSLQNKVKVYRINGMQDENLVFQDEVRLLPLTELSTQIPVPRTLQVIKRPALRTCCSESVSHNFSILTPISKLETEPSSVKKVKDGGKVSGKPIDSLDKARVPKGLIRNDQMSDAGSMLDDKMSTSTKTVGTKKSSGRKENLSSQSTETPQDFSALSIIPEGFIKQTRWIIPPHAKINLLFRFWASVEQDFDHTFSFQMVGAPGKASFHCKATCTRPQISCCLKKPSLPNSANPAFSHSQSQSFKKDQMLDFGAILAGVNPEGFPGIQDSEHSIRLTIHNTGLFDLHVDFDILADMSSASIQKSNKQLNFFLHPPSMDLKIDEKQDLRIYCYPKQDQLGILEGQLVCRVTNNPEHLHFKLRCLSDVPRINLEPSVLIFERLLVGLEDTKDMLIRNISSLCIQWKIHGLENGANEFSFSEACGTLDATCSKTVHVNFAPVLEKMLKEQYTLQVFYGKGMEKAAQELTVNVTAEAYKMDIVVKNQNSQEEAPTLGGLNYGTVKVVEDSLKTLVLQNNGKYTVLFSFCMRKHFSEIFSVTPIHGKLEPKEEQRVAVHFNKEGKLTREVNFQKSQEFQLSISESHTKRSEQKVIIPVSVKAVYTKFLLVPEHGIHFGSQVCGTSSVPRSLTILNVGESPFNFRLSSLVNLETGEPLLSNRSKQENAAKKESEKATEGGKGGDTKKTTVGKSKKQPERRPSSVKPEALELKCFTLAPPSGTINPNEKQEVMICFKAEALGSISESVRVTISDCDPLQYPQDNIYNVSGDSCMPGIDTSPETIFEEHQVIESINFSGLIPPHGTFSRKEHIFSFGPVIVGPASSDNIASSPANRFVESRLKIENSFNVPCSLQFLVSCSPQQGQDSSMCFSVSPKAADIPPLEYVFVTCLFHPTAIKNYAASFEVILMIRGQAQKSLFKCNFLGEGTLPSLSIEAPSLLSPPKTPWLKFPRVLTGKSKLLPIVLQNKGLVTVTGKFKVQGKDTSWISFVSLHGELQTPLDFESSFSIPSGEFHNITVTFLPKEVKQYKEELQFIIDDNPSEKLSIQITGEGYDEDIVFVGLPMDADNVMYFEDCPLGSEKSLEFTLQNKSVDKHWHFEWPNIACLTVSPTSGYLLAGQSQRVCATFSASKPIQYIDQEIKLQVCSIIYKGDVEQLEKSEQTSAPQQGLSTSKKVDTKVKMQSDGGKEPPYEFVKGSNKVIIAKLCATADSVRHECSVQEINFKTTMMFQKRAFSFLLKNASSIVMSFNWMVQSLDGNSQDQGMYIVSPSMGSLQAKESAEILVRFCPTEVEDCNQRLICDIPHLDSSCSPLKISLTGKVARPWCYFELLRSDCAARQQIPDQGSLNPRMNVIEFDSLGSNLHGMKYFVATNPTKKPYKFIWEEKEIHHEHGAEKVPGVKPNTVREPFKCLTLSGEIMSGRKYEMAFQYTPARIEHHESHWNFKIPEHEIEVPFLLVSNIKMPALTFDRSITNFGQVLVGSRVKQKLHLKNEEPVPFFFCFARRSYNVMQHADKPIIKIKPRSAVIKPASMLPIEITFAPATEGRVSVKAICNVKRVGSLFLSIRGEAYQYHDEIYMDAGDTEASKKLSTKEVNFINVGQVQTDDKCVKKFTLTNCGRYPFQFLWDWGQNAALLVEPAGGCLNRDEKLTCELSIFMASLKEKIDIPLTCQIMHGSTYNLKVSACCPLEGDEEGVEKKRGKH